MDKKKAICEYLRKNHIGKGNAIHSKELEKLFMLDGRNIRRKISSLRQDGFPICSDESGYYYADNQKEINNTVCRLNELVTKVSNARTGLLFASILGENDQTMDPNRAVYGENHEIMDVIFGPFFICDCSGQNFGSLDREQLERFKKQFRLPEKLISVNGKILSVRYNPDQEKSR